MSQCLVRNHHMLSVASLRRRAAAAVSSQRVALACETVRSRPWDGSRRHYTAQVLEKNPGAIRAPSPQGPYDTHSRSSPHQSQQKPHTSQPSPSSQQHQAAKSEYTYRKASKNSDQSQVASNEAMFDDIASTLFIKERTILDEMKPVQDVEIHDTLTMEDRAVSRNLLEERMVLVYACLESGDISSAEKIFNRSLRTNLMDMREIVDARMLNAFIEAHLAAPTPSVDRAMDWFNNFDSQLSIKHTSDSFALLARYHLRAGQPEKVPPLIERMELEGITLQDLLENDRFEEDEDKTPLEAVLREMGRDVDGIVTADRLLLSAIEENAARKRKEAAAAAAARQSSSSPALSPMDMFFDDADGGDGQPQPPSQPRAATSPMSTQSLGIKVLRKALQEMESSKRTDKYEQQLWLEERTAAAAVEDLELTLINMPENVRRLTTLPADLVAAWNKVFVQVLKNDIQQMKAARDDAEEHGLERVLSLLRPEQLSKITITEFLRPPTKQEMSTGIVAGEAPFARLALTIGKRVEEEHHARKAKQLASKHKIRLHRGIHQLHSDGKLFEQTVRRIVTRVAKKAGTDESNWLPPFPDGVRARLGAYLVERLVAVARVRVRVHDPADGGKYTYKDREAFIHSIDDVEGSVKHRGMIKYNPALYLMLMNAPVSVDPWLLPMLVPPQPWITWKSGGYIQHQVEMVRVRSDRQAKKYLHAADDFQQMTAVQQALDFLGSIPWKVNHDVYDVAAAMWNNNEHAPYLPSHLEIPEIDRPEDYDTNAKARMQYGRAYKERTDKLSQNYSVRADANYKLEIARAFLGEIMYFPHNLDFRGRAYPMPQHLNHIGNDLCRGLLSFATGKPLGEAGLQWLKIQIAALAGYDKASFADRERFTEDNLENVFDSADKPLEGNRWWLQAESPWQLLAACIELTRALRSEKPVQYISHLPIHQDGTCNGLQHYAALGGDELGAAQVNLVPNNKPADVYSGVAENVKKIVDADAALNVPEALLMKHRINRKLVKQTVMTNTYGVTFIGARTQIRNRLREARELQRLHAKRHQQDRHRVTGAEVAESEMQESKQQEQQGGSADQPVDPLSLPQLTDPEIEACSLYITRKVFEAMGKLFEGARALQVWLNASAGLIARSTYAEHIPPEQLEMAEQLNKMGVLPSPFTVAREETKVVEEQVKEAAKGLTAESAELAAAEAADADGGLLGAILDDLNPPSPSKTKDIFDIEVADESEKIAEDTEGDEPAKVTLKSVSPKSISKMTSVVWTTPLGLPVVQPYRNYKPRQIQTMLQTITILDRSTPTPVNPMKQSTAFPPNFIHSLDAAHMMVSALECQKANIAFAAVHDSYWTHAADVHTMNNILRDAFVRLHSKDLMAQLRNEFIDRYKGHKVPVEVTLDTREQQDEWHAWGESKGFKVIRSKVFRKKKITTWVDVEFAPLPARGSFKIEQVKDSQYFFN
ncbi:hypothetical protein DFJ77DRAFT_542011 [Powellomyces hirtus]|nr:hypothetical protein DFJ77DRAFT_542011 [Powellomyces hirtus]